MNDKKMFHEDTIIYSRSLDLMETARKLIGQFPSGFGFLADQLHQNTSSVSHNDAEGVRPTFQSAKPKIFGVCEPVGARGVCQL